MAQYYRRLTTGRHGRLHMRGVQHSRVTKFLDHKYPNEGYELQGPHWISIYRTISKVLRMLWQLIRNTNYSRQQKTNDA